MKKPNVEDLDYIRKLWKDQNTMKEVGGPVLMGEKEIFKWHKNMESRKSTDFYRLIATSENEYVGEVSFHRFDGSEAYLNIKIEHTHRGKGHARAALKEILRLFFEEWRGEKIIDDVKESNYLASKFLTDNGFSVSSERSVPGVVRFYLSKNAYSEMIRN